MSTLLWTACAKYIQKNICPLHVCNAVMISQILCFQHILGEKVVQKLLQVVPTYSQLQLVIEMEV